MNILYAGSETGQILRSTDAGNSWSNLGTVATDGSNTPPVWGISPSPANCNDVLVGVGYEDAVSCLGPRPGNCLQTVVLGTNQFVAGDRLFHKQNVTLAGPWTGAHGTGMVLPRAPVFSIVRDPAVPITNWFVATDVGVFRTRDGGNTWKNATAPLGLPNVPVRSLRLSADHNTLYAGTFGRSIWSMDVNPPANFFGVRGIVTQASRPLPNLTVTASGPGRIKRWLKNTLTTGVTTVTAPIEIEANATISAAQATVVAPSADIVSLVAPDGTMFPMILSSGQFELLSPGSLVGRGIKGRWSFQVHGKFDPQFGPLTPQVQSANIELGFNGVSTLTDSNGEYTFDYLNAGAHVIAVPALVLSTSIHLSNHQTGVNFAFAPVGVASLTPQRALMHVPDRITYDLAYTITNNRSWRQLDAVQLLFRDNRETVLALEFDPENRTFREVRPNGSRGPAFEPGRRNRLETDAATVYLEDSRFVTDLPDASSFAVDVSVSFKPKADKRIFNIEIFAVEKAGNTQGPYQIGVVQVGDIPVPILPPVFPDVEQ